MNKYSYSLAKYYCFLFHFPVLITSFFPLPIYSSSFISNSNTDGMSGQFLIATCIKMMELLLEKTREEVVYYYEAVKSLLFYNELLE